MIKHTFPDELGILKASKNNCYSLKALVVGNPLFYYKWVGGSHLGVGPKVLLERKDKLGKGAGKK